MATRDDNDEVRRAVRAVLRPVYLTDYEIEITKEALQMSANTRYADKVAAAHHRDEIGMIKFELDNAQRRKEHKRV